MKRQLTPSEVLFNVDFDDIPNNSGGIIDINNQKVGIYKDTSRKYFCC